jgi:hypothetical protein
MTLTEKACTALLDALADWPQSSQQIRKPLTAMVSEDFHQETYSYCSVKIGKFSEKLVDFSLKSSNFTQQ